MRILVVGAGATGGYFGGRLAEAGRDVTFLVRPARAERLRADGLRVVSPHGDVALKPALVTPGTLDTPYDLVLLSVKAYALDQAVADLAPAVGPGTVVLPVLNGLAHLDVLDARFGRDAVLGGLCMIASTLDTEGRVVQLTEMQEVAYGDRFTPDAARMREVDAALSGAGFPARLSASIMLDMWEKWVFLASLGAVTCLMRGTVGEVVAAPGGREFAERVAAEAAAVAAASGYPIRDAAYERTLATVTAPGSDAASSMYRDLTQGYAIEADHIIGDLVARAGAHGVPVPTLGLALTHLSVHQARR